MNEQEPTNSSPEDDDVEGHMPKLGRGAIEPDTVDVEGHVVRPGRVEAPDADQDDVEGHSARGKA